MYTYKLLSCCTKFTPIINTSHAIPDTIKRVNKKDTIPFAQPKLLNFLFNDNILFLIGFKRIASNELFDRNSTMIQKILTYEGLGLENY